MRCEECSNLLDDYIEHELSAQDADQVAAHLAACATCARSHQRLTREQKAYAQYLLDVEATPALWNNLQTKIEEEKSVRALPLLPRIRNWETSAFGIPRLRTAQITALALVAIGAIIGLIKYQTPVETPKHDAVSQSSKNIDARTLPFETGTAKLSGTSSNNSGDNLNKRIGKNRFVSSEKRHDRNRWRASEGNQAPRIVIPKPEIDSRDAGENAKEQLMLALRITSTQLYVAQKKIQEEQRRIRPATPVSEPNREMR